MRKRGFSKLELVVTVYIFLLLLPLLLNIYKTIASLNFYYYDVSGNMSIVQLRKILLLSYDIEVNDNYLSFNYQDKDYEIYLANDHLIMTPGTQIIYEDVVDATFYIENDCIFSEILKDEKYEKICLSKADGFSLDTFLDGDDGSDELSFDVPESSKDSY